MSKLGPIVVAVVLGSGWVLLPIGLGVAALVSVLSIKRTRLKLGGLVCELEGLPAVGKWTVILPVFLLVLAVLLMALRSLAGLLALPVGLSQLLSGVQLLAFDRMVGVYMNGAVIRGPPLLWEGVHTWQSADKRFYLLTKQGARVDFSVRDNAAAVRERLAAAGIPEGVLVDPAIASRGVSDS